MKMPENGRFAGAVVAVCLLTVYLLFPTKNFYWDGVEFAQTIEDATNVVSLIHPNHLIYNIAGYALYKLSHFLGFEVRALTILIAANSVISAIAAFVFFQICLRIFKTTYVSVILTLVFGFSATWWKFSTDVNSYIPSILFSMLAVYCVLPGGKTRPFAVAILHAIAMCFHQLSVFMFPVLIAGLLFQTSGDTNRERIVTVFNYGITAFVLTFGSYGLGFFLQTGSLNMTGLFGWLSSFSPEIGFVFNLKDCIKYTIGGDLKLLFRGRLNLINEVIGPSTIVLSVLGIASLLLLVVRTIRALKHRAAEAAAGLENRDWIVWVCGIWLVTYHLFLFVWIPQNTFYRMFYLPPFLLLSAYMLLKLRIAGQGRRIGQGFVTVLFCSNFLFLVYRIRLSEKRHLWNSRCI